MPPKILVKRADCRASRRRQISSRFFSPRADPPGVHLWSCHDFKPSTRQYRIFVVAHSLVNLDFDSSDLTQEQKEDLRRSTAYLTYRLGQISYVMPFSLRKAGTAPKPTNPSSSSRTGLHTNTPRRKYNTRRQSKSAVEGGG